MAPDNPVGDGDAGTVTASTAPASSTPATGSQSPPPSLPPLAAATSPRPASASPSVTPPASQPHPAASVGEPATAASATPTPTTLAPLSPNTTTTATDAAATETAETSLNTIPHDTLASAAEAAPGGHLNGEGAEQSPSTVTDSQMSNHLLLGRPDAAPPASRSSPSTYTAAYRADAQPQLPAAPSTPLPAPPPSTNHPTTQFAPYSTVSAPPTSQPLEAQRSVHSNGPNAVTLPSMRTIDAMAQQSQQQPLPQSSAQPHTLNGPLQPAPTSGQSYYAQAAVGATSGYGFHTELSRYPLPHDPRLPGTRGSKKVGSIACYPPPARRMRWHSWPSTLPSSWYSKWSLMPWSARRFDIDTQHLKLDKPRHDTTMHWGMQLYEKRELDLGSRNSCAWMRKSVAAGAGLSAVLTAAASKRECLGYDPIFRQQPPAQPGSTQLAPSPTASAALPSSNPPGPSVGNGRHVNAYAAPPQPSVQPTSFPSSSVPPTTTARPTPNVAYHSTSATAGPPEVSAVADPRYDYSSTAAAPRSYQSAAAFDPARHVDHPATGPSNHRLPEPAPKMNVHQIIDSLGPGPARPPQVPASEGLFSEITKVYHEMYASGLASFFETTFYYFSEAGIMSFPKYPPLLEQMASFLKVLEAVQANDQTQMAYSGVLETRIVWDLACTAFQAPERSSAAMRVTLPDQGDGAEARSRLQVVNSLLCGEYLQGNALSPPVADANEQRTRQFDFWYNLADFVRHRDNPESTQAQEAREEILGRMRRLLEGRENRDLLYSIAVVRHLSPSFGRNYDSSLPQHFDETDPKHRLAVASNFIMDEAQLNGGTTNVVRRISDIACRAFVNPGFNIATRT
ncbi:hypothetical protein ISF_03754 [Cordyceps fumosorosea ARSEF 2679]|uniref:Negative acting factor n=1 Tax=Cordyceps fumosorosea (strain ARSEF 2679) TaxID=1081104 RepID=A0A167ZJ39_CORFA|nr:hypothetical protein ISF_03754 [Cordyceps fumosorosea ARSEF 2679]OAA67578.1 hypothetical protein ISF_03754 [Cordyceps fumosorosea ARSEF 2679]